MKMSKAFKNQLVAVKLTGVKSFGSLLYKNNIEIIKARKNMIIGSVVCKYVVNILSGLVIARTTIKTKKIKSRKMYFLRFKNISLDWLLIMGIGIDII
jgi:hypothetical protein